MAGTIMVLVVVDQSADADAFNSLWSKYNSVFFILVSGVESKFDLVRVWSKLDL
jgi:hypothetical protein